MDRPEEAGRGGMPNTRTHLVATLGNVNGPSRHGTERRAARAPAAGAAPLQRDGEIPSGSCVDHVDTDARPRGQRLETEQAAALRDRQMKTEKCTSSSSGATAVQLIKGRGDSPGLSGEDGQGQPECESAVPADAPTGDRAIRGRAVALGAARAVREAEVGDGRSRERGGTSRMNDDRGHVGLPKRRRVSEESVYGSPAQLGDGEEAARPRPGTAVTYVWRSRKDLLESLRSGVRPPENTP